ncbi:MAG TPA: hypothetical protein VF172_06875 [Nitrososphaera sp.]
MSDGPILLPVVAGLLVGIALIGIFSSIFNSSQSIAVSEQNIKIRFLSMPSAFAIGSSVQPMIRISGVVTGCVTPPYAEIRDTANNQVVWDSGFALVLCDPDAGIRSVDIDWHIGASYIENGNYHENPNAMVAEKAGIYELTVQYAGVREFRTFEVLPPHLAFAYPDPMVTMKVYWIREGGNSIEMTAGDNQIVEVRRGQDAVFDIELVSFEMNRTGDFVLKVFNADDPSAEHLLFARITPPPDMSVRLPDGISYTLDEDVVSAKPMVTTKAARLVIHTAPELAPAVYNIGVAKVTHVSVGELESNSASVVNLPIKVTS